MRKFVGCVSLSILLTVQAVCARRVLAQPAATVDRATTDARAAYRRGLAAYNAERYEEARKAFSEAFELKPGVLEVLRSLGAAEVRSEHWLDGARHLQRWIGESSNGTAWERDAVAGLLLSAEQHIGRLRIRVDEDGADVTVDGERVGQTPLNYETYVEPGPHLVRTEKGGTIAERSISVADGGLAVVTLQLSARAVSSPAPAAAISTPRKSTPPRRLGTEQPPALREQHASALLVGGSMVLAGVGLGSILFRAASRADDDANRLDALAPCAQNCDAAGYARDARNEAGSDRVAAAVSFSVAGAAALGTTAYFLWVREPSQRSRSLRPIITGSFVALTGLGVGIAATIAAKRDHDASNSIADAFDEIGLGDHGCLAGTDSVSLCAELFKNNRSHAQNQEIAVAGFGLAGAAALGTVAYLAWPQSKSSSSVGATVDVHGQHRMLVLFGAF